VRFAGGAVGVIGMETLEDRSKLPKLDNLYLDFGATSRETSPVKVGDIGAFDRPFLELGDRWVAKSMDDRIGVAVLMETIKRLRRTPNLLQFAFTVQEEVGIRGARTSAFGLTPDVAIAVDVTQTGDTPRGRKMAVELGKGPAIKVRDSGLIADPRLVDLMVRRAEQAGIPYQLEVLDAGTTDASAIQISQAGVPAGCISIPTRYIHTPSEMVDRNDVDNAVRLLLEILRKPIELKS
jgi:endoglucanase